MSIERALLRSVALLGLVAFVLATASSALAQRVSDPNRRFDRGRAVSDVGPLNEVITTIVSPSSWDAVGGAGSIRIVDEWGIAVISQTPNAHEEIERLLDTIRKVRQEQGQQAPGDIASLRPSSVESKSSAAQRKAFRAALESQTEIEYIDTPLEEVIEELGQLHDIPIKIDERALEEIGLTTDVPVSKQLSGISLRAGMNLLMRDLGLAYIYQDEVMLITTPEESEQRLVTRVYPVKDLVRISPVESVTE